MLRRSWLFLISYVIAGALRAESPHSSTALTKLRDIHLPAPIGRWPLAWGWILLMILLLLLFATGMYYGIRRYQKDHFKRQALKLLEKYQQQYETEGNSQASAACVSELLKRVALIYFPRNEVASLQGQPWLDFLNRSAKGLNFNTVRRELVELPYEPGQEQDLTLLFKLAKEWINQRRGICLN